MTKHGTLIYAEHVKLDYSSCANKPEFGFLQALVSTLNMVSKTVIIKTPV
jgi:hypothetical protein